MFLPAQGYLIPRILSTFCGVALLRRIYFYFKIGAFLLQQGMIPVEQRPQAGTNRSNVKQKSIRARCGTTEGRGKPTRYASRLMASWEILCDRMLLNLIFDWSDKLHSDT